jgi:4-deoxy-L-threo-5-hexosulose-uronate ketol-isomerase
MFEDTIRRMSRPQDVQRLNTQEMRDTFLVTNLFTPGQINGTFTDLDRLVIGGVMPVKPVALPNHRETGCAFFSRTPRARRHQHRRRRRSAR